MNNNSLIPKRTKEAKNGILYLVGTPIGNLEDITQRAISILENVSLIACEDTRQTKKIMNRYHISNKLTSFNKHNSLKRIPKFIADLKSGKSIAIVSDAGLPGICDPGENIVNRAKSEEIDVLCIPGACAATTALIASGMPSSRFIFEGFLPKKKIDRDKILLEISKNQKTTIIYESPKRLKKLLSELLDFCGGDREITVSRELTKKFEEHVGNNINEVIEFFRDRDIIGEITIVLKGVNKKENLNYDKLIIKRDLNDLIHAGLSLSAASKYLAKKSGIKKSEIYNMM